MYTRVWKFRLKTNRDGVLLSQINKSHVMILKYFPTINE